MERSAVGRKEPIRGKVDWLVLRARRADGVNSFNLHHVSEVIRRSIVECCIDDHRRSPRVLKEWLRAKTPKGIEAALSRPGTSSIAVENDGVMVAFASFSTTGKISDFYVAPEARFSNAGILLLTAIEKDAKAVGIAALRLKTTSTGREFFLRNGFVKIGVVFSTFGIRLETMRKSI